MKVTARILADVDPSIKEKLKHIAKIDNETMVNVLTRLIEKEFEKVGGSS